MSVLWNKKRDAQSILGFSCEKLPRLSKKTSNEVCNYFYFNNLKKKLYFYGVSLIYSTENLPKWVKSPVDITTLVPYENINKVDSSKKIIVYWNTNLEQIRRECMSIPTKHRNAWIQKKQN